MTGKTHMAIGMTIGLSLSFGQPLEHQLTLIVASTIGALAPDLDHPKGELNQKLLLVNNNFFRALFYLTLGSIFIYLYSQKSNILFMLLGMFSFTLAISTHRSFTHSIVGLIILAAIIKLITIQYSLSSIHYSFTIGYASHLVSDFFTRKGIRLFYPIKANVSSPLTFKNNGFGEKTVFALCSLYSLCLFFMNLV
ncbi:metal-dependent hydrolase [Schnuerera sp. xch1]|uniref:metal-dependent hydrolase n=1 Tax=Schnuerera sp. xch1 TaxID=2874283 RepID=UPI001CC10398|nr:metal-dependent hydrolase [Schnuerera sp. xch1]MBZ2175464.1 metal-dependent hydrolase [Schnuerera sp. xch1]